MPPGRSRRLLLVRATVAGVAAVALAAGGLLWAGVSARHHALRRDLPGSIDNLVLEAGPGAVAAGHDYGRIATRAEDPRPLSLPELARVFPPGREGRDRDLSVNCASAVTGRAVKRALASGGCSQVLRLITTAAGSKGRRYTGLIEIFNLASGAAVYQAARTFGEESPVAVPGLPANSAPGGFIRPWPGTPAANIADAAGNAADVDAFGHFLVVLWSYGGGAGFMGSSLASTANGLFEFSLDQFAENRSDHDSAR